MFPSHDQRGAGTAVFVSDLVTSSDCITGTGTVADPVRLQLAISGGLICTSSGLSAQQCYRSFFELGKAGTVSADLNIADQHKHALSSKGNVIICDAYAEVATAGNSNTIFQVSTWDGSSETALGTFNIPSGQTKVQLTGLIDTVLGASLSVVENVISGSNATDFVLSVYTEDCDGTPQVAINNSSLAKGGPTTVIYDRGDGSAPDVVVLNDSSIVTGKH